VGFYVGRSPFLKHSSACIQATEEDRFASYYTNMGEYFRIERELIQRYGKGMLWVVLQDKKVVYVGPTKQYWTGCDYTAVIGLPFAEPGCVILLGGVYDIPETPGQVLLDFRDVPPTHESEGQKLPNFSTLCTIRSAANKRVIAVIGLRPTLTSNYVVPVTFIVDSGAPNSYLTKSTKHMLKGAGFPSVQAGNIAMERKLGWYQFLTGAEHYENVNILGMDLLFEGCLQMCGGSCSFTIPMPGPDKEEL